MAREEYVRSGSTAKGRVGLFGFGGHLWCGGQAARAVSCSAALR